MWALAHLALSLSTTIAAKTVSQVPNVSFKVPHNLVLSASPVLAHIVPICSLPSGHTDKLFATSGPLFMLCTLGLSVG